MSDKKDKDLPDPDELQKMLQDMFGKLGGASMPFPGFSKDEPETDEGTPDDAPMDIDGADAIFDFNYKPRDIKSYLDRFVIRQDEAKKALSIAVCDHYNHAKYMRGLEQEHGKIPDGIEYQKQNVIVVGPTGVGKTYLIKHIAEMIGVPFVKADATKFSETGYVGGDVDDLVRELVQKADGDVDLAEYGIVYIDEIDKLAGSGGTMGRDVSGRGVQTTLLKLMEETEVAARNPNDMKGQMMAMMDFQNGKESGKDTINTRHILFIVSGAFSGLEKVIKRRLRSGQIGFGAEVVDPNDAELFNEATTQDYIDFGFEAEFIGRLPVRVVCDKLESKDFVNIMKNSEGSLLRQYEREFAAYGIQAKFEDSAIKRIADRAESENTGARALMTVCESILRDFKFELPGTAVSELSIDADLIDQRETVLAKYRELGQRVDVAKAREEADLYCRDFQEKHNLKIHLTDEAVSLLGVEAAQQGRSVLQLSQQKFKDLQFGLKLIQKNTGQGKFELDAEAVEDADKFLSDRVVQSYTDAAEAKQAAQAAQTDQDDSSSGDSPVESS
ncbi:AAA family ATPase [Verrucomicrobiaceae bacterium R5-34]|uniref:AAA family ATPase n=1 Tax=Oceaniferula flava TaxID=2800421 RepID=A0AAE2S9Z7_9BACT|nr:AAA family ATPase [Oceaniferula flavus]MBK1829240.1 AAA family ATPase [Verrucomicrobiaceae bacterium R5-34]MBK1853477.1 AAA family ATPase [Oceaniferula flavus]MBM1134782.1 AAA family ATPase [Oceaniferula flavus]